MEKFERLTAVAAPLLRDNVDTDLIIRIERLIGTTPQNELGKWSFEALRYRPDGSENPDFVLNQPDYRNAAILLAGQNFGCGSSREGAVWALQHAGIRCAIAPSFGEIFYGNCFQNGVLPIVFPEPEVRALASEVGERSKTKVLTVDLTRCEVLAPSGLRLEFSIAPMRREALLRGIDEIGLTLSRQIDIDTFQAADRRARPWIYETAA